MSAAFKSLAALALAIALLASNPALAQSNLSPGFAAAEPGLSASERAGREIWFFATAFNDRFYTYTYPQRLGGLIDWYLVLAAKNKRDLFAGVGCDPRSGLLRSGRSGLPGQKARGHVRPAMVPGRR